MAFNQYGKFSIYTHLLILCQHICIQKTRQMGAFFGKYQTHSRAFDVFKTLRVHHDCLAFANKWRDHDAHAIVQNRRLEAIGRRLAFHDRLSLGDGLRHMSGQRNIQVLCVCARL